MLNICRLSKQLNKKPQVLQRNHMIKGVSYDDWVQISFVYALVLSGCSLVTKLSYTSYKEGGGIDELSTAGGLLSCLCESV